MAATAPSSDSMAPPLQRRARRLVFDRRYGWIFDEWTDPADQALSGGRGMFCAVTMARSLVNGAVSSINFAASSVSRVLKRPKSFSLPAYMYSLAFHKQQAWLRDLEHSGVVADLKLIHCSTHSTLECSTKTGCRCLTRQHDLLMTTQLSTVMFVIMEVNGKYYDSIFQGESE